MLVNPLADEGLVELVDNPKHKRSKLVQLTRQGRLAVEEIERRERPVLEALTEWLGDSGLDAPDLEQAAAVLEAMRERLADKHVLDLLKGEQA
jgi:DNA-binding MarR family transcriptional regulator